MFFLHIFLAGLAVSAAGDDKHGQLDRQKVQLEVTAGSQLEASQLAGEPRKLQVRRSQVLAEIGADGKRVTPVNDEEAQRMKALKEVNDNDYKEGVVKEGVSESEKKEMREEAAKQLQDMLRPEDDVYAKAEHVGAPDVKTSETAKEQVSYISGPNLLPFSSQSADAIVPEDELSKQGVFDGLHSRERQEALQSMEDNIVKTSETAKEQAQDTRKATLLQAGARPSLLQMPETENETEKENEASASDETENKTDQTTDQKTSEKKADQTTDQKKADQKADDEQPQKDMQKGDPWRNGTQEVDGNDCRRLGSQGEDLSLCETYYIGTSEPAAAANCRKACVRVDDTTCTSAATQVCCKDSIYCVFFDCCEASEGDARDLGEAQSDSTQL
eukprot:CAMPEP_0197620278 /NCGR_PEP_ID=MMETSP1338-20131121/1137_1 /TAXON_ID=43686 ORGANISM="Pelagodinium beii, Strain RCC1491" /NCGR_SAMPLE_ID=MMETSP1338 /ASSEMBLY_ACC=CAM_ASM_000754 /LENGTH=387 /DNA_ID=CAMNT_0043189419 /DNA_START=93 /DNA_END=1256 /DNA_ORIENTATION=+